MKKASQRPKQRNAFRENYLAALIAVAAIFFTLTASAQTPKRSQLQQINATGYTYKAGEFRIVAYLPLDSAHGADSGAIAYKQGRLWISKDTIHFEPYGKAIQLTDSSFVVGVDTITISGVGGGIGTGGLFGITDTTTSVDRYANMQNHELWIDSASDVLLQAIGAGNLSKLFIGSTAYLQANGGGNSHAIGVSADHIEFNTNASNKPPTIIIDASDSLKTASPTLIVTIKGDSLKTTSIADLSALVGGGGSQTLQQTFDQGTTLTKHNRINNTGKRLVTTGQVINNSDTTTSGWIGSQLIYGTSIDAGFTGGSVRLISHYGQQTAGALGLFNDNRALSGTTLVHHATSDNCMEDLYASIPKWDPSIKYIIIGTYPVNDVQYVDSATYATHLANMIDSLHLSASKIYPLSTIVVLNGTPAPSRGSSLQLLAAAALHTAINKGTRYFDSYDYLDTDHSNIDSDSLHLNIKGQYNLANALLNATTTFDSVNYTRANNIQAEQALSVNGKAYLNGGYTSTGNDSTTGNHAVSGNFSLYGNFVRAANFSSGITVAGDNVVNSQRLNLYSNGGQRYGVGVQTNAFGNFTSIYSDDYPNDGIQGIRYNHTDGTTITDTLFRANDSYFKVFPPLIANGTFTATGLATFQHVEIPGDNTIGHEWNLFYDNTTGVKFGLKMHGTSPYHLDIGTAHNVSTNDVRLIWYDTDGTTPHPILVARKDYSVLIPGLATGGTAPTTSGTTKMVVTDANGQLSFDNIPSGFSTIDAQYTDANNTGTSETDLYSKTIAANTLTANGQSIGFEIGGDISNVPTATVNMILYFAGSSVGSTGAITATGGSWTARGTIMRSASGGVRIVGEFIIASSTSKVIGFATYVSSSIDYTTTNIFKITGTSGGSGGASNQITARYWKLIYQP